MHNLDHLEFLTAFWGVSAQTIPTILDSERAEHYAASTPSVDGTIKRDPVSSRFIRECFQVNESSLTGDIIFELCDRGPSVISCLLLAQLAATMPDRKLPLSQTHDGCPDISDSQLTIAAFVLFAVGVGHYSFLADRYLYELIGVPEGNNLYGNTHNVRILLFLTLRDMLQLQITVIPSWGPQETWQSIDDVLHMITTQLDPKRELTGDPQANSPSVIVSSVLRLCSQSMMHEGVTPYMFNFGQYTLSYREMLQLLVHESVALFPDILYHLAVAMWGTRLPHDQFTMLRGKVVTPFDLLQMKFNVEFELSRRNVREAALLKPEDLREVEQIVNTCSKRGQLIAAGPRYTPLIAVGLLIASFAIGRYTSK